MKKTVLLLTFLFIAVFTVSAQSDDSNLKLSAGFSVGGTIGTHAADLPVGGGVHVKLEYPLVENQVSLMLTAGYTFFVSSTGYQYQSDSYGGSYSSGELVNFVPVTVGARLYVANRIFVQGDVGASFNINSTGYTNQKTGLIVSPSAGYALPFGSSRFGLDLSLAYEERFDSGAAQPDGPPIGNWGMAEFRLAFRFGL